MRSGSRHSEYSPGITTDAVRCVESTVMTPYATAITKNGTFSHNARRLALARGQ